MHSYASLHVCTNCGMTRSLEHLQRIYRTDLILNLPEYVFVCADEKRCAYLKVARLELLAIEAKPVGKVGRPKKPLKLVGGNGVVKP